MSPIRLQIEILACGLVNRLLNFGLGYAAIPGVGKIVNVEPESAGNVNGTERWTNERYETKERWAKSDEAVFFDWCYDD